MNFECGWTFSCHNVCATKDRNETHISASENKVKLTKLSRSFSISICDGTTVGRSIFRSHRTQNFPMTIYFSFSLSLTCVWITRLLVLLFEAVQRECDRKRISLVGSNGWELECLYVNLLSVTRSGMAVGKKAGKICEAKIYFIFELPGEQEKKAVFDCKLV
jgi:hypothetical protein